MTQPTAADPWLLTLAWTPDQNWGAVSLLPSRTPVWVVIEQLLAGTTRGALATEYDLTDEAITVLANLAADLDAARHDRETTP